MSAPGRYWDSCTFLKWLNGEDAVHSAICDELIKRAKAGQHRIVTSTLTFAEVYKMKKGPALTAERSKIIRDLFDYSWVVAIELDRQTAEMARDFIWQYGTRSWDAVHLASAIKARSMKAIDCFDTFDSDLISLNGRVPGTDLLISEPQIGVTLPLFPRNES